MPVPSDYARIDVAALTSQSAPPFVFLTFEQRNDGRNVKVQGQLLLIGPDGVNYAVEKSDSAGLYLRRWDKLTPHERITILRGVRG